MLGMVSGLGGLQRRLSSIESQRIVLLLALVLLLARTSTNFAASVSVTNHSDFAGSNEAATYRIDAYIPFDSTVSDLDLKVGSPIEIGSAGCCAACEPAKPTPEGSKGSETRNSGPGSNSPTVPVGRESRPVPAAIAENTSPLLLEFFVTAVTARQSLRLQPETCSSIFRPPRMSPCFRTPC